MTPFSRQAIFLASSLLLLWGALPYLPGQIDDTFIVFAYAWNFVERGELVWNTGVRVEGYSSPLHLLLMIAGAFVGFDLSIFARVLSFGCALGVLGLFVRARESFWVPMVLLALWQPFEHWSIVGMETMLAALVGAIGWGLVLGSAKEWAVGCWVLCGLCLVRPEGMAWLGVGLLLRGGRRMGWEDGVVGLGLVGLGAYHVGRVMYFGEVWPAPAVAKLAVWESWEEGWRQTGRDLLSASVLIGVTLGMRRTSWLVWVPVLIQAGLQIRANGDWMGNARFLLPGLVSSIVVAWQNGTHRALPKMAWPWVGLAGLMGFAFEPSQEGEREGKWAMVGGWRDPWYLTRPQEVLINPWSIPIIEETSFLVEYIPPGSGAYMFDVGVPGNIADIKIWDSAGLTDHLTARFISRSVLPGDEALLKARYEDKQSVWCLRYSWDKSDSDPADDWLKGLLPVLFPTRSANHLYRWRCRTDQKVSEDVQMQRWERLSNRYPSQDWFRWYMAQIYTRSGQFSEAVNLLKQNWYLSKEHEGWFLFGERPSFYRAGRGWPIYANGSIVSLAIEAKNFDSAQLLLDVDDPGVEGAKVRIQWQDQCGEVVELSVFQPIQVKLPACDMPGRRSLEVSFLNDVSDENIDRNLYVSLSLQ